MELKKCVICGKELERSSYSCESLCSSECFAEYFWLNRVAEVNEPTTVIVDKIFYNIGEEDTIGMRGFDGAIFNIEFYDGRNIKSTNLWCAGHIPEKYLDKLKDNAKFIR